MEDIRNVPSIPKQGTTGLFTEAYCEGSFAQLIGIISYQVNFQLIQEEKKKNAACEK